MTKTRILKLIFTLLIAGLLIGICIWALPFFEHLLTQQGRDAFKNRLNAYGAGGWFLFLGLQIVQVVIAIIPGEPIELLSGFLYGSIGGTLTCLFGLLIGTVLVYYTVARLGKHIIDKLLSNQTIQRYEFLHREKNQKLLIFILFLIPGTPKDMLIYVAPFTKLKPLYFFVLATVARIPSVVTSTIAGSSFQNGNFVLTVIVFAVIATLGISGIIVNDRFLKRKRQSKITADHSDS